MLEPISIDLVSLNFNSILPMVIIIVGALSIICIDLVARGLSKSFYTMLTLLFILLALGAVVGFDGGSRGFFDTILVDGIAILTKIIILITSALFIPLALSSRRFQEFAMAEFYALFLFMIAGFMFMVSSDNLIMIFIGLETASLALYTMIAMHNRPRSLEASIKYFTMGALAAGFFVMSALIFYALTGSVEIHKIAEVLHSRDFEPLVAVLAATVFMIGALGFKLSMVPFHTWTPDVYEGSSAALAGYMSIVPKIAGFVVAIRIFDMLIGSGILWLEVILYIIVVLTMTLGNLIALVQEDVKRMLAFSSISHAGFVMAAILIGSTEAHAGLFLYWILFMFANLGAFAMLWASRHRKNLWHKRYQHPYSKFSGMIKIMPVYAVVMGVLIFALAGMPPFSLFWGKLYLMSAAVNSGFVVLAVIMALNSALAIYYYMKLIVYMFLKEPVSLDKTIYISNISTVLKVIIGFMVMVTITSIFMIEPLLETILSYVALSGY